MSGERKRLQLFLDSNVLTGGMVARWGLDKAILSMCAARVCQLILAEPVRDEVETNLLHHTSRFSDLEANAMLSDYAELLRLASPRMIAYPDEARVVASRHLIAHASDLPVLLSAMDARPDWLLTHNTRHFTPQVAASSGLQITTPVQFFRHIARGIGEVTQPSAIHL